MRRRTAPASGLSVTSDARRSGETIIVLLAAAQFFCILACLIILRPAREALGLEGGIEAVRWLFMGTLVATLLVHPIFAWLVSRTSRRFYLPATYRFFAASLVAFWFVIEFWPEAVGPITGRVYYVWHSVFNLAVVGLFWSLLADGLRLNQSKRLFGMIAVGGTLGAITGSAISAFFVLHLGTAALLLIGAALLEVSVWFGRAVGRRTDRMKTRSEVTAETERHPGEAPSTSIIGGSAFDGFKQVAKSPYLLAICGYIIFIAIAATFLYFTKLRLVEAMGGARDENTRIFAHIDLWTQIATVLTQAFVTGWIMRRIGVGFALAMLPVLTAAGFIWLAMVPGLIVLVIVQAMFRAAQRGIARPARETLFTVVSRSDKYKAKSFIDTFVHRGGDVLGAQIERPLALLAPGLIGLSVVIIPIAAVWAMLGIYLGLRQRTIAEPMQCNRSMEPV